KIIDGWEPDLSEAAIAAAPPSKGMIQAGDSMVTSGETTTKKTTAEEGKETCQNAQINIGNATRNAPINITINIGNN
ncbi:hypothetical protein LCGC14_1658140, partial [marine sediment metagenome]